MGRFKIAIIALLLPSCLFIAVLLFAPAIILSPIANSLLDDLGYELTSLEDLRLGVNSSSIGTAKLAGANLKLSSRNMQLSYSLPELLRGRLYSLRIGLLNIEPGSGTRGSDIAQPSPNASMLLQSLDRLPVDELIVDKLLLEADDGRLSLELALQTQPLLITGDIDYRSNPQLASTFRAQRTTSSNFEASASVFVDGEMLVNSDLEIDVKQQDIDIDAISTLDLAEIMKLPGLNDLPSTTSVLTDTLQLESSFAVQDPFDAASIQDLTLVFNSPSSTLHLSQQSDLGENDIQLRLPVSFSAQSASMDSGIELSSSDLKLSGYWQSGSASFQAESSLSDTHLSCVTTSNCDLSANWTYELTNWNLNQVAGENLSVSGRIELALNGGELRASSPVLKLSIPAIRTASINSSVQLTLAELDFIASDSLFGEFSFHSTELTSDIPGIILGQSSVSGRVQLEEDVVIGIVEIDLNRQLRVGLALQHFFFRDYGDAEIQLPRFDFSSTTPLSSLLDPSLLNGDIVAGQLEGHANISWSRQPDGRWEFGGPVILRVENLSGFYNDAYFLDLDTDIFAEATTPWGLRTNLPQTASIASIDIGIPVENIAWQYSFDSMLKQFQLDKLNTQVLGGNVAIEHLEYQADQEQIEFPVVLSNLDLNSIVSLADYPGLQVDGLISGYLPLVLSGNKITLEEGLVGALRPGGSIRYTPADPTPSSNPSMQLVNDALSNYQYESLNTEVFYDELGDLLMQVQLRGTNPDMNAGQAINLNVNITDNIPTLLRSLQASRVITEELESMLENQ